MISSVATTASERNWLVGLVSAAHFYSHFVMLVLPSPTRPQSAAGEAIREQQAA